MYILDALNKKRKNDLAVKQAKIDAQASALCAMFPVVMSNDLPFDFSFSHYTAPKKQDMGSSVKVMIEGRTTYKHIDIKVEFSLSRTTTDLASTPTGAITFSILQNCKEDAKWIHFTDRTSELSTFKDFFSDINVAMFVEDLYRRLEDSIQKLDKEMEEICAPSTFARIINIENMAEKVKYSTLLTNEQREEYYARCMESLENVKKREADREAKAQEEKEKREAKTKKFVDATKSWEERLNKAWEEYIAKNWEPWIYRVFTVVPKSVNVSLEINEEDCVGEIAEHLTHQYYVFGEIDGSYQSINNCREYTPTLLEIDGSIISKMLYSRNDPFTVYGPVQGVRYNPYGLKPVYFNPYQAIPKFEFEPKPRIEDIA